MVYGEGHYEGILWIPDPLPKPKTYQCGLCGFRREFATEVGTHIRDFHHIKNADKIVTYIRDMA